MRAGIIGTGGSALSYYHALHALSSVDRVIFFTCDSCSDTLLATLNADTASSLPFFLRSSDAVFLCSSAAADMQAALAVLDAGVPLLADISVFSSVSELVTLVMHAKGNALCGVGNAVLFNPVTAALRENLPEPQYVSICRQYPLPLTEGGAVFSMMSADVDAVRELFLHAPYTVSAVGGRNVMYALLQCGDVPFYLSANQEAAQLSAALYAEGADMVVEGDFFSGEALMHSPSHGEDAEPERAGSPLDSPLELMLTEFLSCVREGRTWPHGFSKVAESLAICEEIVRSAAGSAGSAGGESAGGAVRTVKAAGTGKKGATANE